MKYKEVKDKASNGGNEENEVLLFRRLCVCIKTLIEITIIVRERFVCFPPLILAFHNTGFCFLREPKLSCRIFWGQRRPFLIIELVPVSKEMSGKSIEKQHRENTERIECSYAGGGTQA